MSRATVKEFLEGFGGRAVLLIVSGIATMILTLGTFIAADMHGDVVKLKEQLTEAEKKVIQNDGKMISRDEFEHRLDKIASDTKEHRAEVRAGLERIDTRMQQVTDLLLSRYKNQTSQN